MANHLSRTFAFVSPPALGRFWWPCQPGKNDRPWVAAPSTRPCICNSAALLSPRTDDQDSFTRPDSHQSQYGGLHQEERRSDRVVMKQVENRLAASALLASARSTSKDISHIGIRTRNRRRAPWSTQSSTSICLHQTANPAGLHIGQELWFFMIIVANHSMRVREYPSSSLVCHLLCTDTRKHREYG